MKHLVESIARNLAVSALACALFAGSAIAQIPTVEEAHPRPKTQVAAPANENQVTRSKSAEKFNAAPDEKLEFVGDDSLHNILPPDQTPPVRLNRDAPSPFIAMKGAYDQGDLKTANAYADQYVRYMQRVIFEVRELSQMIGEAMVRNNIIDEDDWVGVSQFMSRETAQTRKTEPVAFKATTEVSLDRITADTNGRAEIYVFCAVDSRYCREMGPAIERVWRLAQRDKKIKMGVYVIGDGQKEWIKDYKKFTGMTMPVQDGNEIAKSMRVSFVPAVIVRAPSADKSYMRTGLMTFNSLLQFVKTVQGQPMRMTTAEMDIIGKPIGDRELAASRGESLDGTNLPPAVMNASSNSSVQSRTENLQRF